MAHNFDAKMDFGESRPLVGSLKHPFIVLAHLGFRFGAIVFYVLANFFSSSFIIQFLILLFFHSIDLWTVKNITGRYLVGHRWWNLVDSEGKNHWRFEITQQPDKYDPFERQIFWAALVTVPLFWVLLVCTAFLTLQWQWMMIATIGAGMTLTNLYGYLRCKWNNTQEMTNYFTKWAFFSMLKRQQQAKPTVPQNGQPTRPAEIV
nr:unnamed protein product [Meloidogyne enterolobii]